MKFSRREFGLAASALALTTRWRPAMADDPANPEGASPAVASEEGVRRAHGDTLLDALKYPADFKRLDYVNVDAPKGGAIRMTAMGGFDSFNPFIIKGTPAAGMGWVYETLMAPVLDEQSAQYGLLAEWFERPKDYSWVAYKLRDTARWRDGRPVTVEDVKFSFEALTKKGAPLYRYYYKNVSSVEAEGDVIRFRFDETGNRELPYIMGQLNILPAHYWKDREFERSSLDLPLGSGAYEVGEFEANRFVSYNRVKDYWGADLPLNIGTNNFDSIRYDFFKDDAAAFDAFKSGEADFRGEFSSKTWATGYDFPAVEKGEVIREAIALKGPKIIQGFACNLRREKFADVRVREAIELAFDFTWINKTIFYDQYAQPQSYFQGSTDLMATAVPEGAELALLEEFRDQLPADLFEKPFKPYAGDGTGRDRAALRRAKTLLNEAGWEVKGGKLANAAGDPFEIEFLIASRMQERVIGPFIRTLERLGFDARIRQVDSSQYLQRLDDRDFDMAIHRVANSESPGNEQREWWGSEAADSAGSRNLAGVKDPVVDALIDKIIFSENRAALEAASRALDRVLLWGRYMIMELYEPKDRIAFWSRLKHPDPMPDYSVGFPAIWWSEQS